MSTNVPTISVTAESHRHDVLTSSDSDDNSAYDMDYNKNFGGLTDVEDFDSNADVEEPYSRKSSKNSLLLPKDLSQLSQGDVTDVEDYNDSEEDKDDDKSINYPELKLSLQEFLQHNFQQHLSTSNGIKEVVEHKSGIFLQAQNLHAIIDHLTDFEDFNTDSEIENNSQRSACVDLQMTCVEQGNINITDCTVKTNAYRDNDNVSVLSDVSDMASALSDILGSDLQGMSEDEILDLSSNAEICQISCSDSSSISNRENVSEENLFSSPGLPPIDITFVHTTNISKLNNDSFLTGASATASKGMFLEVREKRKEEVLTDTERFDDSVAEGDDDDSFDGDDDNQQPIPQAVILAIGDDGGCTTDCEDLLCDDVSEAAVTGQRSPLSVEPNAIPLPQREVVLLQEDKFGDTITSVMPMDKEYQFGIYATLRGECLTDTEEYSCSDDLDVPASFTDLPSRSTSPPPNNVLVESDITVANELLKTHQSKRLEIISNTESVTDVEEIYVAGTNSRKKKLKSRPLAKSKSKFLEAPKSINREDAGSTDIEDMDLSESGPLAPKSVKKSETNTRANNSYSEKITDVEDVTADDVSSVSEAELPLIDTNTSNLKDYEDNCKNIVVALETCEPMTCHKKTNNYECFREGFLTTNNNLQQQQQQQQTDVEDVQLPSDAEDCINTSEPTVDCVCNELNEMLNESCTTVHEKCSNNFDIDAEKLHIKETLQTYIPEPQQIVSIESIATQGILKFKIESEKNLTNGDGDGDKDVVDDVRDFGNDKEEEDEDYDYKHEHDKSVIDTDSSVAKLMPSNIQNVCVEATVLVDNILEESVNIVNAQYDRNHIETYNVVVDENTRAECNSESENYAITCDDVGGLDVIKSPTIESMSGRSFDDNLSFTDEHIATSTDFSQEQVQLLPHDGDEKSGTKLTTFQASVAQEDRSTMRTRRVEHKFQKISSNLQDLDIEAAKFDEHFESFVPDEEISHLQGDFSKISWDDSQSPTTNTLGEVGQNTPDNDIQDLAAETKSIDITPVPPTTITLSSPMKNHGTDDGNLSEKIADVPKPKPRSVRISTPTEDCNEEHGIEKTISQITHEIDEHDVSLDLSDDLDVVVPIPKPRSQMKTSDSFKNLESLNEHQIQQQKLQQHQPSQSDSVSLRSFDYTEEISHTDDPSVSLSISTKSQHLDYPLTATTTTTTTTTTTSEDPATESIDPSSELSIDDGNVETERRTSFYIGESSRNIIIKTTPTKLSTSETAADEPLTEIMTRDQIEETDTSSMKEIPVDSEEENDVFKEYVTLKCTEPEAGTRIRRQSSETRNDLLEEDAVTKETIESTTGATAVKTSSAEVVVEEETLRKTSTEQSFTTTTITSTTSTSSAPLEVIHSTGEDDSVREISESMDIEVERPIDLDLSLEKSEWETTEKEIPPPGKGKIVHSPQQLILTGLTKDAVTEDLVTKTLKEVQESLDAAKTELKSVLKDGTSIKESPSEFEFRSFSQTIGGSSSTIEGEKISDTDFKTEKIVEETVELMESEDISSFIGVPESLHDKHSQGPGQVMTGTVVDSINRESAFLHYSQTILDEKKPETSLGFISDGTGSQDSHISLDGNVVKEERASLGFISSETAEDFSSMEEYYQEKLAKADIVTEASEKKKEIVSSAAVDINEFGEITSEITMKPFEDVVHRTKTENADSVQNRWSVPEIDQSSSSESYYKSFDRSEGRPLSSDIENLMTQANSSDYQTAADVSSVYRETTEFVSAVSTLESSSGKTISSHESMRSFDSQSETSANLGSIDVSELSETLVASSTEEAEEIQCLRDLADEEDSENSLDLEITDYTVSDSKMQQQSQMKRSQEMIFKPKSDEILHKLDDEVEGRERCAQNVQNDEHFKVKEIEKTWGLTYPMEEGTLDELKDAEDILLYHGDVRRSIDESKYASSLDEGSILSVSMSSTSMIETVVENVEEIAGSLGASSLAGIEAFASSFPEETTFMMEIEGESGDLSSQDSLANTPSGEARTKRNQKGSESTAVPGDESKIIPDKDATAVQSEGKESESESDTDPYETEYARQFRCPSDRKSKKKKQAAAEMDHSFESEKRPFTPSQLVAEVIVEDSLTEELEAKECLIDERRPSQNMLNYANIPDITVTEDSQSKSPTIVEDTFEEKTLYKVKTETQLHKATDDRPLHNEKKTSIDLEEENFQKLVQEQYKQKLAELTKAEIGESDYDYNKSPDSPDSFEMVDQPDISDEFVIIEEVAKEANEDDLGGKSIRISSTKYESKHDEEVEKIIIKSAPADPKLGSQIFRDDLNFEFEESPPTASSGGAGSEIQDESETGSDLAANNKRWVEMQLTDNQMRYPYDLTGGVLEDIKEEDGEFEVGSSRISSFKDSFSSTPEYDVMAVRRYYAVRGEHDDISMSSLQEFESLEQAISLENRNRTHQGSTDSSNGSFQRRYLLRNNASGATAQGDDISISSLKEFEGLENACLEAHLIEIKAKEEAALLSRSDESNKSEGSDHEQIIDPAKVVVTKAVRTLTQAEVLKSGENKLNIEKLLKQKLTECEQAQSSARITDIFKTKTDSDRGSIDSLDINRSLEMITSSVEGSFDMSKDGTTKSDIDSLEVDKLQPTRDESIESIEVEQIDDVLSKFAVTLGDGFTTTTTTTSTSRDADGREHTTVTTRIFTQSTLSGGGASSTSLNASAPVMMSKDFSAESLDQMSTIDQTTTSSAGTTATYQTSAGNSQMSGSVTSCASSTLMEESAASLSGLTASSTYWSHEEETVKEGFGAKTQDVLHKEDGPQHH